MPAITARHIVNSPSAVSISWKSCEVHSDGLGKISPIAWWRTRNPSEFVRRDAASLRLVLASADIDGETRWHDVITGDVQGYAATAIGICVRQIKAHPIDAIEVDLAVSATLSYALLGDAACAVLMAWALKHRARIDPPCSMLSDLWLIANFEGDCG